jgi:hypothetical protein
MKKNITVIILSAMLLALCGSAEAQQSATRFGAFFGGGSPIGF